MTQEHPFAPYVRILGKGPNLSRPLTRAETRAALGMIMRGEVEPAQLGAFLCLLRVKTETPDEMAGFVEGIRDELALPTPLPTADLDWPSWAGKGRQLPYYVLAALLLAKNGVRVFMHGAEGHTAGRVYVSDTLKALGIPVAESLEQVGDHLAARNFAYATLPTLSARLAEIMDLKSVLGLRSPLHSVGRSLNPLGARHQLLSVTHPPYIPVHAETAVLVGQPHMAVFKGEGGEAERRPHKPCTVHSVIDGVVSTEDWSPLMEDTVQPKAEVLDLARLKALWEGVEDDPYGRLSVIATVAVVLRLLGRAATVAEAQDQAAALWASRT